jgi:hypothetical protein
MKMKPIPSFKVIFGVTTAFLAFSTGAYLEELSSARAQANALIQPFVAAMKSQDDLASLDWAKSLEGMDHVQAFQIRLGSRVIAVGGNQDLITQGPNCGPFLRLPKTYYFMIHSRPIPQEELTGAFIIKVPWGPLISGLAGAFCFLIAAWTLGRRPNSPDSAPNAPIEPLPPMIHHPSTADWKTQALSEAIPGVFLLMDERWNIRFLSTEGLRLFGLPLHPEPSVHLMDWNPHPQLVQILESGKPGTCPGGFTRLPLWLLEVKPIPSGGWTLILSKPPDP